MVFFFFNILLNGLNTHPLNTKSFLCLLLQTKISIAKINFVITGDFLLEKKTKTERKVMRFFCGKQELVSLLPKRE